MAGPRQSNPVPLALQPGLYSNETDGGAKGRWIRGDNVRWKDGLPEKVGGYELSDLLNPAGAITLYMGFVRSNWEWDSLDGETWIAFGTACKLYLINRGVLYDITPMRRQTGVATFTTTNLSTTVTVNDPGHGATEGDHYKTLSSVTVGGLTIPAGEYTVATVVDLDNFTFVYTSAATSGATSTPVSIQYDISCGLESDGPLFGYGTGPYGSGTYGTARTTSDFQGRARVWSLDNWGEDLMASPNGETLYVWRRTTGPDSRATAVPGAPANIEKMLVGPDDRHVIAFGTNLAAGPQAGTHDKMFVRWCVGDNYEQWLSAATNDAGSKRLDSGSRLITAIKTRNGILVFSDRALYFVSLVGGTDVYQIAPAGNTVEVISPESVVDVDGTVYCMGRDDFYKWDGTQAPMNCEIRTLVFGRNSTSAVNQSQGTKVHARVVREFNEIWWSYPSGTSNENDATAIYNYKIGVWYFSSIPREAGRNASPSLDRRPYAFYNHRFWIHEEGTDGDDGDGFVEPLAAYTESYQADVMEGAVEVRVSKLIPDFDHLDALVDVTVMGREYPHSDVKTRGPYLVFDDTEYVCPDLRVRQIAIRIDSNDLGASFRMGTWKARVTPVTRKSG